MVDIESVYNFTFCTESCEHIDSNLLFRNNSGVLIRSQFVMYLGDGADRETIYMHTGTIKAHKSEPGEKPDIIAYPEKQMFEFVR